MDTKDTAKLELKGFASIGAAPPDPILEDEARLAAAAALYDSHQNALKDVLEVLMLPKAIDCVTKLFGDDLVTTRGQIYGIEEVFEQFKRYSEQWKMRCDNKKAASTEAEDAPRI